VSLSLRYLIISPGDLIELLSPQDRAEHENLSVQPSLLLPPLTPRIGSKIPKTKRLEVITPRIPQFQCPSPAYHVRNLRLLIGGINWFPERFFEDTPQFTNVRRLTLWKDGNSLGPGYLPAIGCNHDFLQFDPPPPSMRRQRVLRPFLEPISARISGVWSIVRVPAMDHGPLSAWALFGCVMSPRSQRRKRVNTNSSSHCPLQSVCSPLFAHCSPAMVVCGFLRRRLWSTICAFVCPRKSLSTCRSRSCRHPFCGCTTPAAALETISSRLLSTV